MNFITDKGAFRIVYAHPEKGLSVSMQKESTLMNAMAAFNTLDLTTGFDILGDIIIDRLNTDGCLTDTFLMEGRYAVPKRIGPREPNPRAGIARAVKRQRSRRYSR